MKTTFIFFDLQILSFWKIELLKFPDFRDDAPGFILTTDASRVCISGVMEQMQDGELVLIDAAGRALSKAEENYSTTERELLALIFAAKSVRIGL